MTSLAGRQAPRLLAVAPMMKVTDRHFRYFIRQLTRKTLLYSEMVTTGAVIRGDRPRILGFSEAEKPLALQLGGADPSALAECARIAEQWGYDEVNLNVGCPSSRVKSGSFGACLMAKPELVADCVAAMRRATSLPITVKHRIGIDELDSYQDLEAFVQRVAQSGPERFVVHARKAWLSGLSPKQNRTVPELRHRDVHLLKRLNPGLCIVINGGIASMAAVTDQLRILDGVMVGRWANERPFDLSVADGSVFGDAARAPSPSRREVIKGMLPHVAAMAERGVKAHAILRHMLNLFAGERGARAWRRRLTDGSANGEEATRVLAEALAQMPADVLDARLSTMAHAQAA